MSVSSVDEIDYISDSEIDCYNESYFESYESDETDQEDYEDGLLHLIETFENRYLFGNVNDNKKDEETENLSKNFGKWKGYKEIENFEDDDDNSDEDEDSEESEECNEDDTDLSDDEPLECYPHSV